MTAARITAEARCHQGESSWPRVGPCSGLIGTATITGPLVADREQRLEVVARVSGEGDHRLGPCHPRERPDLAGDDVGKLLVVGNADDRDKVPLPRHRVRLGHTLYVGESPSQSGERV